jgi:hypothetical protein
MVDHLPPGRRIEWIARELGREIASPAEARQILGLPQPIPAGIDGRAAAASA